MIYRSPFLFIFFFNWKLNFRKIIINNFFVYDKYLPSYDFLKVELPNFFWDGGFNFFFNRKWYSETFFQVIFLSTTKIDRVMIIWKLKKHRNFSHRICTHQFYFYLLAIHVLHKSCLTSSWHPSPPPHISQFKELGVKLSKNHNSVNICSRQKSYFIKIVLKFNFVLKKTIKKGGVVL